MSEILKSQTEKNATLRTLVAPSPLNLLVFADQLAHPEVRGFSQMRRDLAERAGVDDEFFPMSIQDFSVRMRTLAHHGLVNILNDVPNPRAGQASTQHRLEKSILRVGMEFSPGAQREYAGYAGHILDWMDEYGSSQLSIIFGQMNTTGGVMNSAPSRRLEIYKYLLGKENVSISQISLNTGVTIGRLIPHISALSDQGILFYERDGTFHPYQIVGKPELRADLFSATVPSKVGLRTHYANLIACIGSMSGQKRLGEICEALIAYNPEYKNYNRDSLMKRTEFLMRWIAKHSPNDVRSLAPSTTSLHTHIRLNPEVEDMITALLDSIKAAENQFQIEEGITKGNRFINDQKKVLKLVESVFDQSPRTKK